MATAAAVPDRSFRRYGQLMRELHQLMAAGKDDGDEAEAVRAEMDPLWYAMTEKERDRAGGLSEDLYILAEGGPKQVAMTDAEKESWSEKANAALTGMFSGRDVDTALKFLRQPMPDDRSRDAVPFLQSRCWEQLGEGDLALFYMHRAERLNPRQAVSVLLLAEKFGQTGEAAAAAERIIANKVSSAEELYQAAATLMRPARHLSPDQARPYMERVLPILERALRVFLTTPRESRQIQDADRYIITMLGFANKELGNVKAAVRLFNDGLGRYPGDATLFLFRGFALLGTEPAEALADFRRAAQAGSESLWPYYFLTFDALNRRQYSEAWQLCLLALQREGGSNRERAQLYEWLAIALAESRQPLDWVLYNLRQARELDPSNERILENVRLAETKLAAAAGPTTNGWAVDRPASSDRLIRAIYPEDRVAPDLLVERADQSFATLVASSSA